MNGRLKCQGCRGGLKFISAEVIKDSLLVYFKCFECGSTCESKYKINNPASTKWYVNIFNKRGRFYED